MGMNREYAILFEVVAAARNHMGLTLVGDEAFEADFGCADGWHVLIEGDPHVRGSFNLVVGAPNGRRFVVRLLMQAFGDDSRPSLDNQIRFLQGNRNVVFDPALPYAPAYERFDRIE
jgi:hypothetical protein